MVSECDFISMVLKDDLFSMFCETTKNRRGRWQTKTIIAALYFNSSIFFIAFSCVILINLKFKKYEFQRLTNSFSQVSFQMLIFFLFFARHLPVSAFRKNINMSRVLANGLMTKMKYLAEI